jgi:hypothetical protein
MHIIDRITDSKSRSSFKIVARTPIRTPLQLYATAALLAGTAQTNAASYSAMRALCVSHSGQ